MADLPIYDLITGEHMPGLDREVCNLIFCIGSSALPLLDYYARCILGAEVYFVSSVEEAVSSYFSELGHYENGMPYSHFFVLYDNICDVYIAGNNFLRHYNMHYVDDYDFDHVNIDFWLFRARYHRSDLREVMDTFLLEQPAECLDIVQSSHIHIDGAQTIDTILGHPVIGHDTCDPGSFCETYEPKTGVARDAQRNDNTTPQATNDQICGSPNRPLSAYRFFANINTDRIRREYPDKTFGEVGRMLGNEWRLMSDQGRSIYENMAQGDRRRYELEKSRD